MAVIVIYICIQKYFLKRFYVHKKQKNQSCIRTDFFKAQILRALLSKKAEIFAIFEKFNHSITTKLCPHFTKEPFKTIELFLVHDKIQ